MKTQLILLTEPILVSDLQVNGLRWIVDFRDKMNGFIHQTIETYPNTHTIIAGIPELPSITYSDEAREVLEKKYGWVDVEKLAKQYATKNWPYWTGSVQFDCCRNDFSQGFKAAQSLNEKKFSEGDLKYAMLQVHRWLNPTNAFCKGEESPKDLEQLQTIVLQSLSQPRVIDVEVEMEEIKVTKVL